MTESETTPNTAAVGLVFDISPADPAVVSVLAALLCLVVAAVYWYSRRSGRNTNTDTSTNTDNDNTGSGGARSSGSLGSPSPAAKARYNTRGHRIAAREDGAASTPPAEATHEQAALCQTLYEAYNGVVPAGGIQRKAVRECGLTVRVLV